MVSPRFGLFQRSERGEPMTHRKLFLSLVVLLLGLATCNAGENENTNLMPLPPSEVQQAAYWTDAEENICVALVPPVGLFGRFAAFLGSCCAEAISQPAITTPIEPTPNSCGRVLPTMCGYMPPPPPMMPAPWAGPMPYPQMMPYPVPPQVVVPAPPTVVVHSVVNPVSVQLVSSDNTGKGKVTLEAKLPDGSTIRCKKMSFTAPDQTTVNLSVKGESMKIKSKRFNGYAEKITIKNGNVSVELESPAQTGVISNPQLAQ